ncbi:MAG TPA: alpha-E domain-containing protein [Bacillales bacterium]|nr:alpha-E domain-containing protein [Bacillales bacterium]
MLSRVADSLFWLSRNVERAENNTRLIDVKWISMLENFDPDHKGDQSWDEIIQITGHQHIFYEHHPEMNSRSVIDFLVFSDLNPNSILNCIQISRENARAIREIIPQELWELINSFYWDIKETSDLAIKKDSITDFFERVKDQSLRLQGTIEATMPRDEAYLFIQMGKLLERAEKTARILDVYYHRTPGAQFNREIVDYHHWWAVLQSVSGHEAFLKKHRPFIRGKKVVEFLVKDSAFPRSIRFCIDQVMAAFMEHEKGEINAYSRELYDELNRLREDLHEMSMDQVLDMGLHHFLTQIQSRCHQIGRLVIQTYYLGELPAI